MKILLIGGSGQLGQELLSWKGNNQFQIFSPSSKELNISNKENNNSMSYHIQFESNMTLSGANADNRVPANPLQLKKILAHIYSRLTGESING